ncbi:MAG: RecQ family ATP-dependent DNA helicase [Patescibacteria group bacterium]|nr:RecQ family ATP-dependent DNA helicase [Patescibacteria group bacterium]
MTKEQTENLKSILKHHWGYDSFRLGQTRALEAIMQEKSSVIIMPTGGGKSLCYQLPALALPGVSIVVSPLIALMKDQVDSLIKIGVPATFINSSISQSETFNRLEGIKNNTYKLLYIAPERFYNQNFMSALKDIKISLFAIDEAHCISEWGHDFRPSYIKLSHTIKLLNHPPVMALTATATPEVKKDLIKQLNLENPEIIITGFARPNLQFGIIHSNEARKPQFVLDAVNSVPKGTGIVYVGTRARVDNLTQYLIENDIEALSYHAGIDPEDRKWVQNSFMDNKIRVIVATNAFGLGIDKADVRFVIHYDMPGTVEAYYQEAGRAGRDGKPSFCLLLYNSRDRALHEFFIKGDNPPASLVREIYDLLLSYESDTIMITYAEIIENLSDTVPDMAIGTCLKILEKEGYVARQNEKRGNAYIRLLKPIEYIMDTISKQAKKQREVMNKLNERFANEINAGWNFLPEECAEIIGVKREALMRAIKKLSTEGLLEYRPPFRGTEIQILKREKASKLKLDESAMKEKLRASYDKLDKIEDYVYSLICRQKYMLNYFGDTDSRVCGKCDICLTGKTLGKTKNPSTGSGHGQKAPNRWRKNVFTPKEEPGEYEVAPADKKSDLSTKLTQLETLDLINKGLSLGEIAEKRDMNEKDVKNHIVFLLEKKILEEKKANKLISKK